MNDESDRILDDYLAHLAQGGSRDAIDLLARRWTPRLIRYATNKTGAADLALDIVQETWVGVIRGLKHFNNEGSFAAWIYGIAHRKCVDAIRGAQKNRRLETAALVDAEASVAEARAGSPVFETAGLAHALGQLSAEHRDVVTLFYGEGLGVAEIAIVLSVPVGTVKSRLHHARQFLKNLLGE
jgi:RNA polymerase sigma-70 factor, ECF subfamily